jgi:hypothetical protein
MWRCRSHSGYLVVGVNTLHSAYLDTDLYKLTAEPMANATTLDSPHSIAGKL